MHLPGAFVLVQSFSSDSPTTNAKMALLSAYLTISLSRI
jgi:hypothetical protein